MIEIIDKKSCSGCSACFSSCPASAIKMEADDEGFVYPNIDKNLCINCHFCEKVCPYLNKQRSNEANNSKLYAFQCLDKKVRQESTAGGAFSLIAEYIIESGGVVFATGYDNEMNIICKFVDSSLEISTMRGSKYVQNDLKDVFKQIKQLLKLRTVLFVGSPCQAYGLKNFIGDNSKLLIMDFICLGVSSPKLYEEWVDYLQCKYNEKIINIQFRNKDFGYSVPNVKVSFENSFIEQTYDSKVHNQLFFKKLNIRPSCYNCIFRNIPRVSDFTIGDFNDVYSVIPSFDDDKGTTKLWLHTKNAETIFNSLTNINSKLIAENQSNICGTRNDLSIPADRSQFYKDANTLSYADLIKKYSPNSLFSISASFIRKSINSFPLKKRINRLIRKIKKKI